MREQVSGAGRTLWPRGDDPDGPLPPLLVLLTVVTGLVDAFSYFELGRVFVANMTGNVVFLSFALGGAAGFVWWASILGVAAFLIGSFIGGRMASTHPHRGRQLFAAAAIEGTLMLAAFVIAVLLPGSPEGVTMAVLIVILGIAMGLQNATARALAVKDLTTTVLTLTIVGISADSRLAGGKGSRIGRRLVSVVSMFAGGLLGTALITAGVGPFGLLVAVVLLVIVVVAAGRSGRSTGAWAAKG